MRVLGIDPGTAIVGFSILDFENNRFNVIDYGCIYTDKDMPMEDRLCKIYSELTEIIKKYSPSEMAIEELFYFKNNKTVISVGQARGVIVLCGRQNNLVINHYTPLQVKTGITGYGKAEKKQLYPVGLFRPAPADPEYGRPQPAGGYDARQSRQ